MASYRSFKKISLDQIPNNALTANKFAPDAINHTGILWIYNECGLKFHQYSGRCACQAQGKCCQWTVPTNVTKATFEIWSGGGGGAGGNCGFCRSIGIGGAGGNYASKTISVTSGSTYTICAGGSWPCAASHTCAAGMGCKSFVTGTGLSNFCVNGGCGGWLCNTSDSFTGNHTNGCANCDICGSGCGFSGADFGIMGTVGSRLGHGFCCMTGDGQFTGTPPLIGKWTMNAVSNSWYSCGCYVNWPAGGGLTGATSYCGSVDKCYAAGAQGGSGIVKVSFS